MTSQSQGQVLLTGGSEPGGKSEAVGTRHAWDQTFALPVTDCEAGQSYLISPSLTFPICKVRKIACSLKNGCDVRNTIHFPFTRSKDRVALAGFSLST